MRNWFTFALICLLLLIVLSLKFYTLVKYNKRLRKLKRWCAYKVSLVIETLLVLIFCELFGIEQGDINSPIVLVLYLANLIGMCGSACACTIDNRYYTEG